MIGGQMGELKGFEVKNPLGIKQASSQPASNICSKCGIALGDSFKKHQIVRHTCGEYMRITNLIWAERVSPLEIQ